MDDIARAYEEHADEYRRLATSILGDVDRASDAVHEAFLRAISSRRHYRGDGPLEGWIWRIVINAARDQRRRNVRCDVVEDPAECAGSAGSCGEDQSDRVGDVRRRIAQLPERQRLVVFLRHYADFDYAQIGRMLRISTGTVGATLHAAYRSLTPPERC